MRETFNWNVDQGAGLECASAGIFTGITPTYVDLNVWEHRRADQFSWTTQHGRSIRIRCHLARAADQPPAPGVRRRRTRLSFLQLGRTGVASTGAQTRAAEFPLIKRQRRVFINTPFSSTVRVA